MEESPLEKASPEIIDLGPIAQSDRTGISNKKIIKRARVKSNHFWNKYHKNKILWTNKLAYLAGLVDGEGYLKIEKTWHCSINYRKYR